MESDEATVQPEQALTEALLALSWPLPRTVEDADAALTRLEEVRAVLTLLEQQSVGGAEAWWAGQVDALATQSGFVLEWWRPVLRDPELDWTLNHQAHLTADLATLASAGARLLDQIEPQGGDEGGAAGNAGGRRAAEERRWGPSAVLPFAAGAGANVPGARPQPPGEVFGGDAGNAGKPQGPIPAAARQQAPGAQAPGAQAPGTQTPGDLEPPQFPPLPSDPQATRPPAPEALNAGAARHRRPSYEFDDAETASAEASAAASAAASQPAPPLPPASVHNTGTPTAAPQPVIPARPMTPAPGPVPPAGSPAPAPMSAPAAIPGQASAAQGPGFPRRPAHGFPAVADEPDEDEPARLVPTGLRRHQRRLLMQTAAILIAIAVLCWWAVYTLSSNPSHPAANSTQTTRAAQTTHASGDSTAAGGVGGAPSPSGSPSGSASATKSPQAPTTSAAPAPSTATSTVADGTTVSSARVTLLGGSDSVPQIVVLITVHTAGTGPINVLGSYYGAKGGGKVAPETDHWTFSGHTSYQYSVPIANGPYCGATFHFTLTAGGMTDTGTTSPGC